jgi:hypothetical protein
MIPYLQVLGIWKSAMFGEEFGAHVVLQGFGQQSGDEAEMPPMHP